MQSEDPEDNYDHVENDHYHIEEDSSVTHAKDDKNDNDVALPLVLNKGVSGRDPDSILGDISYVSHHNKSANPFLSCILMTMCHFKIL